MKLCITGGAGFIGSHTVDAARAAGHEVVVIDDLSTGRRANLAPDVVLIAADLADKDALRQAVAGCDAVIHLAALVSVPLSINEPLRTFELNTLGSARVLDAAREAGCVRVVLASTASVYGDLPGIKTEGSPVAPMVPYATSKLLAEGICQSYAQNYAMSCVRLRYFNVYGVRQLAGSPYSGVLTHWLAALHAGASCRVFGDGEQTRDFVNVRDVARANVLAATAPCAPASAPLFNVASGESLSLNQILAALGRAAGRRIDVRHEPARAGDIRHSACDPAALRAALGWRAEIGIEEGLREMLA